MKVSKIVNKPKYEPITITLESADEYFSLLGALGSTTYKGEVQELANMGILVTDTYEAPSEALYEILQSYVDQVKETL